jgi:hypothetical protein
MKKSIEAYTHHLVKSYQNRYTSLNKTDEWFIEQTETYIKSLHIDEGKVYYKVCANGSVHSFIVKNSGQKFIQGDILKAASFAAPAKNKARGNVFNEESYQNIEWCGV